MAQQKVQYLCTVPHHLGHGNEVCTRLLLETLATNSCAVAFTPPTYLDELSRGLKMSSFSKSKFSMATLLNGGI